MLEPASIDRAHDYYMNCHLWWNWDYECWDRKALAETIFWYACAGQAISHESTAEKWLKSIMQGRPQDIPKVRRGVWQDVQATVPQLVALNPISAFSWFSNGNARKASTLLDDICYVGPKIASWILRDMALLKDYADEQGPTVSYRPENRTAEWFRQLPERQQAAFVPLDRWVIRGAKKAGALPGSFSIETIQRDRDTYFAAAESLVSWARTQHLDPRDLDIYWYLRGTELVKRDGSVNVKAGTYVWFRFPTADSTTYREGRVLACKARTAVVTFTDNRTPHQEELEYERLFCDE